MLISALTGGGHQGAPSLRPYQIESIAAVRHEHVSHRSTLLVAATGTGKTVSLAELARLEVSHAGRVLILVHRDELVRQTMAKCEAVGLYPDVEKGKQRANLHAKVVIASVQTLRGARLTRWARDRFTLVIVDEAHHAVATGYRNVLSHFDAAKVLGVTATPDRADGVALGEIFETVAYRYEIRQAIAEGYLVPITARRIVVDSIDLSAIGSSGGDFVQTQLAQVMGDEKALRGIAVPLLELARDRRTIAFCVDVKHARDLAATLNRLRPGCARSVSGETDEDERRDLLEGHTNGAFQFLTNCLDEQTEILSERGWVGIDEISENEVVATMDTATSRCEWQSISRVVRRDRAPDEPMVRVSNQTLDARITGGHRMVVGVGLPWHWGIKEASTLPERVSPYRLPVAAFGEPAKRLDLTLDECKFIGLWIADGHLDRSGGSRGITISQSQRYVEANTEIQRLLTSCRFDWKVTTSPATKSAHLQNRYRIPKGTIGGQLQRRGYARLEQYLDKDLSPLLFNLDRAQTQALVEGIWLGDGTKYIQRKHRNNTRRSWQIVNTNKTLLDRLQRLVVTRGFGANISAPKKNGPLATKPIFTIIVRDRASVGTNNHSIATSGGNPAVFESKWESERVWCVTTPNGTIITRRNGKVLVMGQCDVLVEGYDSPVVACVAMCRPTKSRGRFVQCAGRGLRPCDGKSDCLILDFSGTAGRHRLVGPVDCLLGMGEPALDEDLHDEIARLLGSAQLSLDAVVAQAEDEITRRREAMQIAAVVRYRSEHIDPFVGDGSDKPTPPYDPRWHGEPASPRQLKALEDEGVTLSKLPRGFSRADAWKLLAQLMRRRPSGLCSFKAAKKLTQAGVVDTRTLSHDRAKELLDKLRLGDWRPSAIAREPEVRRASALEAFA